MSRSEQKWDDHFDVKSENPPTLLYNQKKINTSSSLPATSISNGPPPIVDLNNDLVLTLPKQSTTNDGDEITTEERLTSLMEMITPSETAVHLMPIAPSTYYQLFLHITNYRIEQVCKFLEEFKGQYDLNSPFPTALFHHPSSSPPINNTSTQPAPNATVLNTDSTSLVDGVAIYPTKVTDSTITPLLAAINLTPTTPELFQLQRDLCHILILFGANLYHSHSPSLYSIQHNPPLVEYSPLGFKSFGTIHSPLSQCILESKFTLLYHFITQYGLILPPLPLSTLLLDPIKASEAKCGPISSPSSSSFINHSLFHLLVERFIRLGIEHGLENTLTMQCFALIQVWLSLTTVPPQTTALNMHQSTFLINRATINPPNYLDQNPLHLNLNEQHNHTMGYIDSRFVTDHEGKMIINNLFDEEFIMAPSLMQKVRVFLFEKIRVRLLDRDKYYNASSDDGDGEDDDDDDAEDHFVDEKGDEAGDDEEAYSTSTPTTKSTKTTSRNKKSRISRSLSKGPRNKKKKVVSYSVTNPNFENQEENIAESRGPTMDYFAKLLEIDMNAFGDLPSLPPRPNSYNLRSLHRENLKNAAAAAAAAADKNNDDVDNVDDHESEHDVDETKHNRSKPNSPSTSSPTKSSSSAAKSSGKSTGKTTGKASNLHQPSKSPLFLQLMEQYCQEVTEKDKKAIRATFDEMVPHHHGIFYADILASIISNIPISELYSLTVEAGQHLEVLSQRNGGIPGALSKNPNFNRKQAQLLKQKIRAVKQQRKKKKGTFRKTVFTRRLDCNGDALDEYQRYSEDSDDEPFFAPSNRRGGMPVPTPGVNRALLRTSARLRSQVSAEALEEEQNGDPTTDADEESHHHSYGEDLVEVLPIASPSSTKMGDYQSTATTTTSSSPGTAQAIQTNATNPYLPPTNPNSLSNIDQLLSTKVSIRSVIMMLFSIDLAVLSMLHNPILNNEIHPFFFFTQQSVCPDSRSSLDEDNDSHDISSMNTPAMSDQSSQQTSNNVTPVVTTVDNTNNNNDDEIPRKRNAHGRFSKTKGSNKHQQNNNTNNTTTNNTNNTNSNNETKRTLPILSQTETIHKSITQPPAKSTNRSTPPSLSNHKHHITIPTSTTPSFAIMRNIFMSIALQQIPTNPIYSFTCFAVHYLNTRVNQGSFPTLNSYSPHSMTPTQHRNLLYSYLLSQSITPVPHLIEKQLSFAPYKQHNNTTTSMSNNPATVTHMANANTISAYRHGAKKIIAPGGNHALDTQRGYLQISFSPTQTYLITKQEHYLSFLLHTNPFISQLEFDKAIRTHCGIPMHYNPMEFSLGDYYSTLSFSNNNNNENNNMGDNDDGNLNQISTNELYKLYHLFCPNAFPTSGSIFTQLLAIRRYDLLQYLFQKWAPFLLEIYHSPRGRLHVINSLIYSNYKSSPMTLPFFNMVTHNTSLSDLMGVVESWYNTYYLPSLGQPLSHPFIENNNPIKYRNHQNPHNHYQEEERPLLFIPNGIMINMAALLPSSETSLCHTMYPMNSTSLSTTSTTGNNILETRLVEPLGAVVGFESSQTEQYLHIPGDNIYKNRSTEYYGIDRNQLGLSDEKWSKMENALMKTASSMVMSTNDQSSPQSSQSLDFIDLIHDHIVPIEYLLINAFIHHEINYTLLISLLTSSLNARDQVLVSLSSSPTLPEDYRPTCSYGPRSPALSNPSDNNNQTGSSRNQGDEDEDLPMKELFDIVHCHHHYLQQQRQNQPRRSQYHNDRTTSSISVKVHGDETNPNDDDNNHPFAIAFSPPPPPPVSALRNHPSTHSAQQMDDSTTLTTLTPYVMSSSTPYNKQSDRQKSKGLNIPMIDIANIDHPFQQPHVSITSSLFESLLPSSFSSSSSHNNNTHEKNIINDNNNNNRLQHAAMFKAEVNILSNDCPADTCGDESDIDEEVVPNANQLVDGAIIHDTQSSSCQHQHLHYQSQLQQSPITTATLFSAQSLLSSAPQLQAPTPAYHRDHHRNAAVPFSLGAIYETPFVSATTTSTTAAITPHNDNTNKDVPSIDHQPSTGRLNNVMEKPHRSKPLLDGQGNENFTSSTLKVDPGNNHVQPSSVASTQHHNSHEHAVGSIQRPLELAPPSDEESYQPIRAGVDLNNGNVAINNTNHTNHHSSQYHHLHTHLNNNNNYIDIDATPRLQQDTTLLQLEQLKTAISSTPAQPAFRHLQPASTRQHSTLFGNTNDPNSTRSNNPQITNSHQPSVNYLAQPILQNDSLPPHNNPDLSWAAHQLLRLDDEMVSILTSNLLPSRVLNTSIQPQTNPSTIINLDQVPTTTLPHHPMQQSLNLMLFAYCRNSSYSITLLTKLFKLHLQIKHHNLKMALYYSIRNYIHFITYPSHPCSSQFDFSFKSIIDYNTAQEQLNIENNHRSRKLQRQQNQLNNKTKKENQLHNNKGLSNRSHSSSSTQGDDLSHESIASESISSQFLPIIGQHNFDLIISFASQLYQKYETSGNCIIQHNPVPHHSQDRTASSHQHHNHHHNHHASSHHHNNNHNASSHHHNNNHNASSSSSSSSSSSPPQQQKSFDLLNHYPQPLLKTLPFKLFPTPALTPAFRTALPEAEYHEMVNTQLLNSFDHVLNDIIAAQPTCGNAIQSFQQYYIHHRNQEKDLFDEQSFLEDEMTNRTTLLIVNCPYAINNNNTSPSLHDNNINHNHHNNRNRHNTILQYHYNNDPSELPIDEVCDRFTQLAHRYYANAKINQTRFKLFEGMILAGISSFLNRHNPYFKHPSISTNSIIPRSLRNELGDINDNGDAGCKKISNLGTAPSISFITILNKIHHILLPTPCQYHPQSHEQKDVKSTQEDDFTATMCDVNHNKNLLTSAATTLVSSSHPSINTLLSKYIPNSIITIGGGSPPIPLPFHYTNLPSLIPLDTDNRLIVPLLSPSMPTDLVVYFITILNAIGSEELAKI